MRPRNLVVLALSLLLWGCQTLPSNVEDMARPEKRRVLHGELIRDMLAQDRNHAALAHLEELQRQQGKLTDDQRMLRAEALYRLHEDGSARAEYAYLTQTDLAGQAWHGIGRLETPHDLRAALLAFNQAVSLRPTDAAVRNDLGYALLVAGRAEDACRHLYTAHELAPQQQRIVGNLLLCEALRGNTREQERLLQVHGFNASERERHLQDVVEMRQEIARRRHELSAPSPEKSS